MFFVWPDSHSSLDLHKCTDPRPQTFPFLAQPHDQEEVSFAMPRFNKVMVRRLRKIERVLEGDVMRVAP